MAATTNRPLNKELPALLTDAGISMRGLAERIGINQSHLSRALRGSDSKRISGELAGKIAVALGLPRDYFPEYREAAAVAAVRANAKLRESIYQSVRRGKT